MRAFDNIQVRIPEKENICIYKEGLIDSFQLMQLLLEIELLADVTLDTIRIVENDISLETLEKEIENSVEK